MIAIKHFQCVRRGWALVFNRIGKVKTLLRTEQALLPYVIINNQSLSIVYFTFQQHNLYHI